MKFTKINDQIQVAENVAVKVASIDGRTRALPHSFRIDGRGGNGYRVDVCKPLFPAWEAIDGGQPVNTITEAKALCRAYAKGGR